MASAQQIITHRNLKKKPQWVAEGITAATYAVTPTNPAFDDVGQDASLVESSNPTVAPNRIAGDTDRKETTKTFEENSVKLMFKVLATDVAFLRWLFNKANGANTPDESRTLFYSYDDDGGNEIQHIFKGCKPMDASISFDTEGYLVCESTLSFKTVSEATGTNIALGTGSYATHPSTTPLTHKDGTSNPFSYNNVNIGIESFSVSVTHAPAMQKVLGTETDLYRTPTQREVSGSVVLYKKDGDYQEAARDADEETAVFIADSGVIIFSFANFKFMPSGEDLKGDNSEATKENKSWEASSILIS